MLIICVCELEGYQGMRVCSVNAVSKVTIYVCVTSTLSVMYSLFKSNIYIQMEHGLMTQIALRSVILTLFLLQERVEI